MSKLELFNNTAKDQFLSLWCPTTSLLSHTCTEVSAMSIHHMPQVHGTDVAKIFLVSLVILKRSVKTRLYSMSQQNHCKCICKDYTNILEEKYPCLQQILTKLLLFFLMGTFSIYLYTIIYSPLLKVLGLFPSEANPEVLIFLVHLIY